VHGGHPKLLRNVTPHPEHWIQIRLVQRSGNRSAYGVRVELEYDGRTQSALVAAQAPYLSQNYPVLHFGLGQASRVDVIRVYWTDGTSSVRRAVPADREIIIYQPAAPELPTGS